MEEQYHVYSRSLLPALRQNGLNIIASHENLTKYEGTYVDSYFEEMVYPVLTLSLIHISGNAPAFRTDGG